MTLTNPKVLPFVSPASAASTASRYGFSSCGAHCPRCKSPVFRVSRRLTDFLLSLFVPIRRYRCISMACSWEGNLREKQAPLPNIARTVL